MSCSSVKLCNRPKTPLKHWMVWTHQVLRVIWVPPGDSREVHAGILGVSILVSMLVMFFFWSTSPVCKAQDNCTDLCDKPQQCTQFASPYANMTVNLIHKNTSGSHIEWKSCHAAAEQWRKNPEDPLKKLVCYFPDAIDDDTIACVLPLQGDACELEKKYRQMLTGASSIGILISFLLVPRMLAGLYELVFTLCCRAFFLKSQGKTIKGVSLGVLILIGLGILVVLLILNGGTGFIGLRFTVWLLTWIGSMIVAEPLTGLITYYLIRCWEFRHPDDLTDNDGLDVMQAPDDNDMESGGHGPSPVSEHSPLVSSRSSHVPSSSPSSMTNRPTSHVPSEPWSSSNRDAPTSMSSPHTASAHTSDANLIDLEQSTSSNMQS